MQLSRTAFGPVLKKASGGAYVHPGGTSCLEDLSEELLCCILAACNWNTSSVANLACTSRRMAAVARSSLWRSFCLFKAPKMTKNLLEAVTPPKKDLDGGWTAFGKLMRFCPGARPSPLFDVKTFPPHLDRLGKIFSKLAGRRLLHHRCRRDVLYITETCNHVEGEDDVGIFRGIFKNFGASRTLAMLKSQEAISEDGRRCPFCGIPVWSLAAAGMIPSSIAESLDCHHDDADVFVCKNGHLHGMCILAVYPEDEEGDANDDTDDEDAFHRD